jgi:serine/threonine protein kinase/formylglycine-generating enzyme required for sulfatase activity
MIDPFETYNPEAEDAKAPPAATDDPFHATVVPPLGQAPWDQPDPATIAAAADVRQASPPSSSPPASAAAHAETIGRYRLERILGEGGFGRVYLAFDQQLNRSVALKIPRHKRVVRPEDAEAFLSEARVLASLDHPNIVPVYDIGTTPDGACYVVSKLVEGTELTKVMAGKKVPQQRAVEMVAAIASALHYAHRSGLVHRDIKPANILLDKDGVCYVADFGLALKEEDYGKGLAFAGTPAYMSPEQARSEGHRVDGRSDIFSLGVIFYEMLVGRRPFRGGSLQELLEAIISADVRPPRQIDDKIPKELERICLKALAKRAAERYTTAKDMAEDLQAFLSQMKGDVHPQTHEHGSMSTHSLRSVGGPSLQAAPSLPGATASRMSMGQAIDVVPKGLRSFDASDAESFLDLLPGPRDRQGLPDSIAFWKSRIEETDADNTFAVGLIYGPSGCGKSSLVKAGLLPRLHESVIPIYLEATAGETEARLLNNLRKRFESLPADLSLKDSIAALRQGKGLQARKKVVIVIDQFEQWLHASRNRPDAELAQALRQCDGAKVQCVLMVRDDFWMSVTRFLSDLEVELVQGKNFAAADLFDIRHAEKVLAAFGRAFGALPFEMKAITPDQKDFLKQAVLGLSQENKVICVRLSLFAEMMKDKAWTTQTLKAVGGASGVGFAFLEEAFASSSANPRHRIHQKAARAVLAALLPEPGADIKGHMKSGAELLEASGYAARPKEFDDLIRILDGEIRLITPTDPAGNEDTARLAEANQRFYQLTHDYLVPSLRDWLTRKQKETRRGRAELQLADWTAIWTARPINRSLPPLLQYLSIRVLTDRKRWTPPQAKMMNRAGQHHLIQSAVVLACSIAALIGGFAIWDRIESRQQATRAAGVVARLLDADTSQVPSIVKEFEPLREWADPLLRGALADQNTPNRQALHASLGLLPVDAGQTQYLAARALDAAPSEIIVLRDSLSPLSEETEAAMWAALQQPKKQGQRLRAAALLAKKDQNDPRWSSNASKLLDDLVAENPMFLGIWMDVLRPVRLTLLPELMNHFRDGRRRESERALAMSILSDYAADQPELLADLILDADPSQFAELLPKLRSHGERAIAPLKAWLAVPTSPASKVLFEVKGNVEIADPPVAIATGELKPAKAFDVPMREGRLYRISMSGPEIDSYLVVTDAAGKQVALDDDGGGDLNAFIAFVAPRTETYRIHAASLNGAAPFSLVVEETNSEASKDRLGKRRASAAVALLNLNVPELVWPLLKHSPDPSDRSQLVHRFGPYGADVDTLVRRLGEDQDVSVQRALLLSLGDFDDQALPPDRRSAIVKTLEEKYVSKDPGLRGAAEWLLRRWGLNDVMARLDGDLIRSKIARDKRVVDVENLLKDPRSSPEPAWYVNGQGQTMIVIPGPVKFTMGSPITEANRQWTEIPHTVKIDRSFAISAKPVTMAEFRKFRGSFRRPQAMSPDCPAVGVSWFQAALYCNWLSKEEGIDKSQWCYEPVAGRKVEIKPNATKLTGYRLPTEAEMEFAIRAAAATSRYFGESEELLDHYAWSSRNSSGRPWPVGLKMPNDLGLFDSLGNCWSWCHDAYRDYRGFGKSGVDSEQGGAVKDDERRLMRGGSYDDQASYLRSAYRNTGNPGFEFSTYGFRVARTIVVE